MLRLENPNPAGAFALRTAINAPAAATVSKPTLIFISPPAGEASRKSCRAQSSNPMRASAPTATEPAQMGLMLQNFWCSAERSGFALVLEPEALAVDADDDRVVQGAIRASPRSARHRLL